MIAFGVCVGDEETYKRHAFPSISSLAEPDTVLLSSRDNSSIFEAYNEMLEYLSGHQSLEALVLVHEDVELRDRRLFQKIRASLEISDVAVIGVIGATEVKGLAWWEGTARGRCAETRGLIDFGGGDHDVEAVDGLCMILSPWAVRNVPFDAARYAGFHGYDVDYCFTARQAGGRVIVTDIDLFHFTKGGFGDAARYECSNAVFMEKWFPAGREANVPRDGTARRQKEGPPAMPTALPTPQARLDTSGGVPLHKHNGVLPEIRIDLGGGKIPLEGSLNLDPCHGEGPWRRLAQDVPWPVDDNTVDKIYSSHMMEHVPAGAERIAVMNEAWRVLRIGGTFEVRVPMFPRWEAIADPTHVSFWVPQSFLYFTGDLAADADYGIKRWTMDSCTVNDGWELRAVLRKPETA